MCRSNEKGYTITVKGKETVAAVLPPQEHRLPLSNLDLLLPPVDVGVFFCYKKHQQSLKRFDNFSAMVSTLKATLAQTLVSYYAFAGEVVTNSVGEPELLCNNRGVDFIQAYADIELGELQLHNPDESVEKKLVPKKKEGVLCIQVTELKCGGMVLACTFDHRIADAYSANMFLVAWAETTTAGSMSIAPCFRRSLLNPRKPGISHDAASSLDLLYVTVSTLAKQLPPDDHKNSRSVMVNRIYYITAGDIERMQVEASSGQIRTRSKMEAFSAYMWQMVGKGAKEQQQSTQCRMGVVVNGRCRLQKQCMMMSSYFGNVLSIPYGKLGTEDLQTMELNEVADAVHEFLQDALTEEHFLDLVDWVEARRPEQAVTRIYCEADDGVDFVVSSGRGFPVSELEFGFGRPVFGSYHFPWGGSTGYVMPMPSASYNGDWVVYMHLMEHLVDALETHAGDVFRKLTPDYYLGDHSPNCNA